MSITESELLHACRYAIGMMLKKGSVEYFRICGGKWHRTSWFDVVDEIDNRLSKIEAEGGTDDARMDFHQGEDAAPGTAEGRR